MARSPVEASRAPASLGRFVARLSFLGLRRRAAARRTEPDPPAGTALVEGDGLRVDVDVAVGGALRRIRGADAERDLGAGFARLAMRALFALGALLALSALGALLAANALPQSWAIGTGKYALLLGANLYGLAICVAGFLLPVLWQRLGARR